MPTQLPRVPSLMPSSFATLAIGRDVSITIFTASSLNSGEKLFFGRGNYFTFPDIHPIGWTVRKLRGTSLPEDGLAGLAEGGLPEDGLFGVGGGGVADAGQGVAGGGEAGDGLDARAGQALAGRLGHAPGAAVRRGPDDHVLVAGGAAVGAGRGERAAGRGQRRDRGQARGVRQRRRGPGGAAVGGAGRERDRLARAGDRGTHGGDGAADAGDVLKHGPGGAGREGHVHLPPAPAVGRDPSR